MTRLLARPRPFPGWIGGLVQDAETIPLGSIVDGLNFVPTAAGRQQTRGGSRIMLTLHADSGVAQIIDTFTDVDGTTLDNHSPPGTSLVYDAAGVNFAIQANRARPTPLGIGPWVTFLDAPALPLGSAIGQEFLFDVFHGTDFDAGAELGIVVLSNADGTDSLRLVFGLAAPGAGPGLTLRRVVGGVTTDTVFLGTAGGFDMNLGDSGRMGITIVSLSVIDMWKETVGGGGRIAVNTLTISNPTNNLVLSQGYCGLYYTGLFDGTSSWIDNVTVNGIGLSEVSQVPLLTPFTPSGAVAVGWSNGANKHYAYRLTSDADFFTGVESTSRTDLTASPSTSWDNATAAARPVAAELFEKLFLADATADQTARNEFLSLDSTGTVLRPTFAFAGGAASALTPYCLEEYNGVLFIAGYGDEGDKDRPEMLRHSFLAKSPDDVDGFDTDAFLLLGAKGQRVTALRKGRGLLLAAKDNEFYRITGFGRAYPGWQYQVENVQNTTGMGAANPLALTFAEGFWYGIGAQGPFRTDGYVVESLVGPRQRGWRAITRLDHATVAYHPERRVILFGVVPPIEFQVFPSFGGVYPWTQWIWDIQRSVWQTDWRFGGSLELWMASAVASTTATGPTAAPSAPTTTDITVSSYTANWANGDVTAETEVWEQLGSEGTWTLVATAAAVIATYVRAGRTSHTAYIWKARHRKSGVTSAYTADTTVQTLIRAPTLALHVPQPFLPAGLALLDVSGDAGTVTTVEQSAIGAGVWSVVAIPTGNGLVVQKGFDYRAQGSDAAWTPTTGAFSATLTVPA